MNGPAALRQIIEDVVAPGATEVDRAAAFPRKAVDALADAGLLGFTVPTGLGGAGAGPAEAADVVRRLAGACGSTATVVMMHYSAVAALSAAGHAEVLREVAAGRHLTTLALSEVGSRSHFWAPQGTATVEGAHVALTAHKSWVTSAREADSYLWSSRPADADGPMSLWLVPTDTPGLTVAGDFDGLGLRGNGSCPVTAERARVPAAHLIGTDGEGLALALATVLPWFLLLNGAAGVGLMQAVTDDTVTHLVRTRLAHLNRALADQPQARGLAARMRITTDLAAALLTRTAAALAAGDTDATLLALELKAATDEAAAEVADLAMRACGGAAFRREWGIERRFRDSRAARVMAPTTATLTDAVGRALCGLPWPDPPAGTEAPA